MDNSILEQWMINNNIAMNEEFVVTNRERDFENTVVKIVNKFTIKKLENDNWIDFSDEDYKRFLTTILTIKMPPYRPTRGEKYYYVDGIVNEIKYTVWNGSMLDYCLLALKNCFRSKKEAEENKDSFAYLFV